MKIERFKQERYSSKERVLRAFHRDVPDRVPINYFANAGIDRRLKAAFGLQPDDGEGLRQALGVDFAGVGANYAGPRLHPEIPGRGVCPMSGIRTQWIEHESGGYWDFCDFPLKDADLETVENWPLPSPDDFAYTGIKQRCLDAGNRAIHVGGPGLGDVINSSGFLRGTEQVLVDLITDDPAGLRLIQRRADLWLEVTRRSLEAAEGLVDFVWLG